MEAAVGLSLFLHFLIVWVLGLGIFGATGERGPAATASPGVPLILRAYVGPDSPKERTEVQPAPSGDKGISVQGRDEGKTPGRDRGGQLPQQVASATAGTNHGADTAGQLPTLRYYLPEELTTRPKVISDNASSRPNYIPDVYPLPVLVKVMINERGGVDRVILGENFLSETAREYITSSISSMTFSPGMIGTLAVRSQWQIVVNLEPTKPGN